MAEDDPMRVLLSLLVIFYLVGVGIALAPTFQANWSKASAAQLAGSVAQSLPGAMAWPATAYRAVAGRG
jgi:hypothetical protein